MLAEICGYLNNYFDVKRYTGLITIASGVLSKDGKEIPMEAGQHFALFRRNFSLGVFVYGTDELDDKVFEGSVWIMDIPQVFLNLVSEIEAWQAKYGGADSAAMSPYNSESFGGYSYTKGSSSQSSGGMASTWQSAYGPRLAQYRKVSL